MRVSFSLTNLNLLVVLICFVVMGLRPTNLFAFDYVYTADDENGPGTATKFELTSTTLTKLRTLDTGGKGASSKNATFLAENREAIVTRGSAICIFISDAGSSDVASFNKAVKVGNYSNSALVGSDLGIALAATPNGEVLYAGYTNSLNIGVWQINADCSLTLANVVNTDAAKVDGMAVTPNGETLVVTYPDGAVCHGRVQCRLDAFAISGATLTETGPYEGSLDVAGLDITKDSKYAIAGVANLDTTIVEIYPIGSDSVLGAGTEFTISEGGVNSNNVRLSPNERFLYVSNNISLQVTTLRFTEDPLKLTFACIATLHNPNNAYFNTAGLATSAPSGAGNNLYVAETGDSASAVGLAAIDSTTGCLTEDSASPFSTGHGLGLGSLAAYPPRRF
jgi:6-phosphogluconolactonase (cycloisomerase 2 family)